jgi:hypothetical protein
MTHALKQWQKELKPKCFSWIKLEADLWADNVEDWV